MTTCYWLGHYERFSANTSESITDESIRRIMQDKHDACFAIEKDIVAIQDEEYETVEDRSIEGMGYRYIVRSRDVQERLVTLGIANPISMALILLPYRRNSNLQTIRNALHTESCAPSSLSQ